MVTKKQPATKKQAPRTLDNNTGQEIIPYTEIEGGALVQAEGEMPLSLRSLSEILPQESLDELWGATPKRAIRMREGSDGKMYPYVPHGYIVWKLNKVFGGDWDLEILPVFAGSIFHLQVKQVERGRGQARKTVTAYDLSVCVKLTVRVRNPQNGEAIASIVKTEIGEAEWFQANPFGNSLKSAVSDGLKRCGMRLGAALDLSYDDDAVAREYAIRAERTEKLKKVIAEQQAELPPQNVTELVTRANQELQVTLPNIFITLYGPEVSIQDGMARLQAEPSLGTVWAQLRRAVKGE